MQAQLLLKRSWRQISRDLATIMARTIANVSAALIFGSIFNRMKLSQTAIQDRLGLLQVCAPEILFNIHTLVSYLRHAVGLLWRVLQAISSSFLLLTRRMFWAAMILCVGTQLRDLLAAVLLATIRMVHAAFDPADISTQTAAQRYCMTHTHTLASVRSTLLHTSICTS